MTHRATIAVVPCEARDSNGDKCPGFRVSVDSVLEKGCGTLANARMFDLRRSLAGEAERAQPEYGTKEYFARQAGEVLARKDYYSDRAFEIALEIRRGVAVATPPVASAPDICERLETWAKLKPERLDFEFLTLLRDAVNAIKTEREMHNAWRKRAEEAELREALAAHPVSSPEKGQSGH